MFDQDLSNDVAKLSVHYLESAPELSLYLQGFYNAIQFEMGWLKGWLAACDHLVPNEKKNGAVLGFALGAKHKLDQNIITINQILVEAIGNTTGKNLQEKT